MANEHTYDSSRYSLQLSGPKEWVGAADSLLVAAQLLEPLLKKRWDLFDTALNNRNHRIPSLTIQNVYLLLMAFAIENLLKSVIIRSKITISPNPSVVQKALPKILKNHKLYPLAKLAGFKMNSRQELLLRRLSRFSIWAGRYPIPTTAKDYEPNEELSSGEEWTVGYLSSSDVSEVTDLLVALFKQLKIDPFDSAA